GGGGYGYGRSDGVGVGPVGALGGWGGTCPAEHLSAGTPFHFTVEDQGTFQVSPEGFQPVFFLK
ncbi:MAG: hypothetical protein OXI83_13240, partial [Gemmatimonadota bacterium]|nr:hypothetical protein [Gemmatimonadota bacterium]